MHLLFIVCMWPVCRHSQSSRDAAWSSVILDQIAQLSAIHNSSDDSDNVCIPLIEVCTTLNTFTADPVNALHFAILV